MKGKFFTLLTLLAVMASCSPYDDSTLVSQISELNERVSAVEQLTEALKARLSVVSVQENNGVYTILFSDKSTIQIKSGKDGSNGKDGETLIDSISIQDGMVVFKLTDGRTLSLPLYQELELILEGIDDGLVMAPEQSRNIRYTVVSSHGDISTEVLSSADIKACIVDESPDRHSGAIHIETGFALDAYSKIVIIVTNGEKMIMKTLLFKEDGIDVLNGAEVTAPSSSGDVPLDFVSSSDYEIIIPAYAASWLSVSETRAVSKSRAYVHVEENMGADREADIEIKLVSSGDSITIHFEQRADPAYTRNEALGALQNLYSALHGDEWELRYREGWFSDEPLNTWSGIQTDEYGSIISLYIQTNYSKPVGGTIPASIGRLKHLRRLTVNAAYLTDLPGEIGQLEELEYLRLNRINYPITEKTLTTLPDEIGNCKNLRYLDVSAHQLESVPSSISKLSHLEELVLNLNRITGTLDPFYGLTNLKILKLDQNQISGTIGPGIASLKSLEALHLYMNNLTGGIPDEIAELKNLQGLVLFSNPLGGQIPPSLGSLTQMTFLSLSGCELTGPIPESLANCKKLEYAELNDNMLTGNLPASLAHVQDLYIYNNQLTGPIPESFFQKAGFNETWGMLYRQNHFDVPDYSRFTIPDLLLRDTPTADATYSIVEAAKGNKMTIILYWASFCEHIPDVMERIIALYDKYHSKGLEVISWSPVNRYLEDVSYFDSLNAGWKNRFSDAYYPAGEVPLVTIFDSNGIMIYTDMFDEDYRPGIENAVEQYLL